MAGQARKSLVVGSMRIKRVAALKKHARVTVEECCNCGKLFEAPSPFVRRCHECKKYHANKFMAQWGW